MTELDISSEQKAPEGVCTIKRRRYAIKFLVRRYVLVINIMRKGSPV